MKADAPVLLYDGLCGFCDGTVRFILSHDPHGTMRFAPLQGEFAAAVLARHPGVAGLDSLVLIEHTDDGRETVHVQSAAVLHIAAYLGGAWKSLLVFRIVPRPLRDFAYALFARYRYRVFGRFDACPVPPSEVRARFLD